MLLSFNARGQKAAGKARAELKDAQGQDVGSVTFTPSKQGVAITLNVRDLAPGVHGIHIHEAGKCDAPDFKTAGGA